MKPRISVVGSSGRVGGATVAHLSTRFDVTPIARCPSEQLSDLAARAVENAAAVVNAAGMAHISGPNQDLELLRVANVDLPLALAARSIERRVSLIHISSVKAVGNDPSPYAASKREADERLQREFGDAFKRAQVSLVVVRPLALLFPPFDAGKLRHLRVLRRWPLALTPGVRLPVLTPATFLVSLERLVDEVLVSEAPGFSIREFTVADRGTLTDVRAAMSDSAGAG